MGIDVNLTLIRC